MAIKGSLKRPNMVNVERTPPRRRYRSKSGQSPRRSASHSASMQKEKDTKGPSERLQAYLKQRKGEKQDKKAKAVIKRPGVLKNKDSDKARQNKEAKEKAEKEKSERKEKDQKEKLEKKEMKSGTKGKHDTKEKKKKETVNPEKRKQEMVEKKEDKEREDPGKKEKKEREGLAKKEKKERKEREDPGKKVNKEREDPGKMEKKEREGLAKKEKKEKKEREDHGQKAKKEEEDPGEMEKKEREGLAKKEKKEKKEREDHGQKAKKEGEDDENKTKKSVVVSPVVNSSDGENSKKKEKPIRYIPAQKGRIEQIFKTPETKKRPAASLDSMGSMTSKQQAEVRLKQLQEILESDHDPEASQDSDADLLMEVFDHAAENDEARDDAHGESDEDGDEEEEDDEDEEEKEGSEAEAEEEKEESGKEDEQEEEKEDSGDESAKSEDGSDQTEDAEGEEEEEKEEDEEVDGQEKDEKEKEHALVPAVASVQEQVNNLKNSVTNKKEWDCFTKQLKTNGGCPIHLSEYATTSQNKVELFNMWLDAKRDWNECSLQLERKMQRKNEGVKGWEAIQGRVLRERYSPEKFQALITSRKSAGLWYPDDDFPDDDDDS